MEDPSGSGGWRFAQCFGDKGEVEDITEGMSFYLHFTYHTPNSDPTNPSNDPVLLSCSPSVPPADIISTVEFDSTGNYLATGDKGGRVVLFERNEMVSMSPLLAPSMRFTSFTHLFRIRYIYPYCGYLS